MYPRARAKGGPKGIGHGDGDAVLAVAQPIAPPLVSDALSQSNTTVGHSEPPHFLLHSTSSHHASMGSGNRQSVHTSQQQPPPTLTPGTHIPPGMYCESMEDRSASSPAPPPLNLYAGSTHHHSGFVGTGMHRHTASLSYEQQQQLLPRPPPLHMSGHQGDWIAGASSSLTMGGTTTLDSPAGMIFFSTTGPPSFLQHSRTSSSMPGAPTGVAGPGCTKYRPPPGYGEMNLGSNIGAGASWTNNSSLASMNRTVTSLNGSVINASNAIRKSSCMVPSPTGVSVGVSTALGATAPPGPLNTSADAPIMQIELTECSRPVATPAPLSHVYETDPSGHSTTTAPSPNTSARAAATPLSAAVPRLATLMVKVSGSASAVCPSAPLSPLINSPSLAQQQPELPARQQRSAGKSTRSRPMTLDPRKGSCASDRNDTPASVGDMDSADAAFHEDQGSSPGMRPSKPTIEEAEARYRYLYEEFLKVSRVRAKLVEESDRMKREQTMLREELDYYRRKVAFAAEEREALLDDYRDDVHSALRLAQLLAADVAAAYNSRGSAPNPTLERHDGGEGFTAVSPQQTLDAAVARISANNASIATAAAPITPPPTGIPTPPSVAEHLGLRCGKWMLMPAVAPRSPIMEEEPCHPGPREWHGGGKGPQHQLGVLLRDEMRDVHLNTHAAISTYMTSLDYGFAPVSNQPSYPPASSEGQRQQQQFSSEYRGLHFHVDVPRFHSHTASGVSDPVNAGGDDSGGESPPVCTTSM
ncbi:hypothetical protein LPMP_190570 [Leishmania panamensis]|uniref:Uncharacterized protein n=1 Tax=Leishmania panamensis TaxID=5679 RepID=A0A088RQ72_LEIPA|nr:hypothetical protein LPMP_190570 [Leishmania panamensis]AIN97399.1 hypothetical protein LPMP_190570 [Leishmania panamensis]